MSDWVGSAVSGVTATVGAIVDGVVQDRQNEATHKVRQAEGKAQIRQQAIQGRFDPADLPPPEPPHVEVPVPWGTVIAASIGGVVLAGGVIYLLRNGDEK